MTSPTHTDTARRSTDVVVVTQLSLALRTRWWLVVAGLVLGLLGGLALAQQMPTQYSATATVRLGAGFEPAGQVTDSSRASDTEAQIASLRPAIDEVAREIGEDPDLVADNLRVANRNSSPLVDFTYDAENAEDAEKGAAVAAELYLDRALQSARDQIDQRLALLRQQATVAAPENGAAIDQQIRNLELTVVDPGTIVRDSDGSAEQAVLRPSTYVVIGIVGGAVLGALLALMVESVRPRVRPGVAIPGLRLLGRITERNGPHYARDVLLPALVATGSDIRLVPVGRCADAVGELLARLMPAVRLIDHADRDDLASAAHGGVILLVLEGVPVRDVRALVERLALAGAAPMGMVTVTAEAIEVAMQVLVEAEDAQHEGDPSGRSQLDTLLEALR